MQLTLDHVDHTVEPAATLSTGLVAGTHVLTLDGAIPVQFLAPGERILTRGGARKLTHVAVRTVEHAEVVRISPSALGHDRPGEELTLAPGQLVLLRDWRAKALYGQPQAVVPACRLADGDFIRVERVLEARFFTLHFEAEAVIYAGGIEVACAPLTVPA